MGLVAPGMAPRGWRPGGVGQNGGVSSTATGRHEASPAVGPKRLVTLPRVVMSVLLALSAAGLYVAFTLHDDSPNPRFRPEAVSAVSPEPGSLELRQAEIFVELEPAYTGTLVVNDRPIPPDQLQVIEGLNRISFTPGAGQEIETLPAGRNCVVVRFEPVGGQGEPPGTYRWCFNVH